MLANTTARGPVCTLGGIAVFCFFTIAPVRACSGPAAAGVPGWLSYPERTTVAQGLPPAGAREAKPRSPAKPGSSSACREGLA